MNITTITRNYATINSIAAWEGYDLQEWTINDGTAEVSLTSMGEVQPDSTSITSFSELLEYSDVDIQDSTTFNYIMKVEVGVTGYASSPTNYIEEMYGSKGLILDFDDEKRIFLDETSNTTWIDITTNFQSWSELIYYNPFLFAYNYDMTSGWDIVITDLVLRVTYTDTEPGNFGLQCFDSTGNITLDFTDRITRVLFSRVVAADTTGSYVIELPDGNVNRTFSYAIPLNSPGDKAAHDVSISGNVVSWTPKTVSVKFGVDTYIIYESADSLITVVGW
jgi:hypothetical protein